VDETRRTRGGPDGEVILLHEDCPQASRRGVEEHAGANDAAADDDDVPMLVCESTERIAASRQGPPASG
jgi:hypothetical protein